MSAPADLLRSVRGTGSIRRDLSTGPFLPQIRHEFVDGPIDELLSDSALPRNEVLGPWRMDCPRRNERLMGTPPTAQTSGSRAIESSYSFVEIPTARSCSPSNGCDSLLVTSQGRCRSSPNLKGSVLRTTSPRSGCIYRLPSLASRSLGCGWSGATESHSSGSIPPSSPSRRSLTV